VRAGTDVRFNERVTKQGRTAAVVAILIGVVVLVAGVMYATSSDRKPADENTTAGLTLPTLSVPAEAATAGRLNAQRVKGTLTTRYIGDSLTVGWNASSESSTYRALIDSRIVQDGPIADTQTSTKGATLAEVAAQVKAPANPGGLLVIELGTNDVNKTPAATFAKQYRTLLDQQQAKRSVLVCVGTWQTGTTAGIDQAIEPLCREYGGTFVKIGDLRKYPANVAQNGQPAYPETADGAHPNDQGHKQMAQRILAALGYTDAI
jgi:lysophospholipase L1-like esterase